MKIVCVIFVIICGKFSLASIQENFLMQNLLQYFDDDNDYELVIDTGSDLMKREISLDDILKSAKLHLDATNEKKRPNHYWTRKRGRETTNNWWNYYETNYDFRPNQFGYPNSVFYTRGKRGIIENLLKQHLAHLRTRRQTAEDGEKSAQEVEKPVEETSTSAYEGQKIGGNFRKSMFVSESLKIHFL